MFPINRKSSQNNFSEFLRQNVFLTVLLISLISITVINVITLRIQLYKIGNYPILLTIISNLVFVGVMFPLSLLLGPSESEKKSKSIHYMTLAFLDGLGSILAVIGGNMTSGPLQLLLGKCDLVLIIFLSKLLTVYGLMSARYLWSHYTGAFIILIGIMLVVLPKLIKDNDTNNSPLGIIIFTSCAIPFSISTIYKEIFMKGMSLGPVYVNAQIAIWQLFFSIFFTPIVMVPGLGSVPFEKLPSNLVDGLRCIFLGENSQDKDECPNGWLILFFYIFVNLIYNLLLLSTIKFSSSSLSVISVSVALQIATILFSLKIVMGNHAVPLEPLAIVALFAVIFGFSVYKWKSDQKTVEPINIIPISIDDSDDKLLMQEMADDSDDESNPFS